MGACIRSGMNGLAAWRGLGEATLSTHSHTQTHLYSVHSVTVLEQFCASCHYTLSVDLPEGRGGPLPTEASALRASL